MVGVVGVDLEILAGDRPDAFVRRMSGLDQPHVDLEHPTRIEFDDARRTVDVVDASAPPGCRSGRCTSAGPR